MQGPLVLRMMDSVRVLIAMRGFNAPNQPVAHLFLVTLRRPELALHSQSMAHGVLGFQSGAVYVEDFLAREPLLLFAPRSSSGLAELGRKPGLRLIGDVMAAHYGDVRVTLEQLQQLVPSQRCDGRGGACFEVAGHTIEFPS